MKTACFDEVTTRRLLGLALRELRFRRLKTEADQLAAREDAAGALAEADRLLAKLEADRAARRKS